MADSPEVQHHVRPLLADHADLRLWHAHTECGGVGKSPGVAAIANSDSDPEKGHCRHAERDLLVHCTPGRGHVRRQTFTAQPLGTAGLVAAR